MVSERRVYEPVSRACLILGIGLAFAAAFVVWLVLLVAVGNLGSFGILALGVAAAVGGMLLAGVCARSGRHDLWGIGRALGLKGLDAAEGRQTRDPLSAMGRRLSRGGATLPLIEGIDAETAQRLNGAGVTRIAQIAAWTDDDIARIGARLGLGDRIRREDWVGQARRLASEG